MKPISYSRHRFPPDVIRHAVWLYFRFTMSFRDVEDLMAERGIELSYETIRRWTLKFGRLFARNLRRSRARPTGRWHLDEMVVKIGGIRMYLWRAVDDEGGRVTVGLDIILLRPPFINVTIPLRHRSCGECGSKLNHSGGADHMGLIIE